MTTSGDIQLAPDECPKSQLIEPKWDLDPWKAQGWQSPKQLLDPVTEGGRNNELTRRAGIIFGTKKMPFGEAYTFAKLIVMLPTSIGGCRGGKNRKVNF